MKQNSLFLFFERDLYLFGLSIKNFTSEIIFTLLLHIV